MFAFCSCRSEDNRPSRRLASSELFQQEASSSWNKAPNQDEQRLRGLLPAADVREQKLLLWNLSASPEVPLSQEFVGVGMFRMGRTGFP